MTTPPDPQHPGQQPHPQPNQQGQPSAPHDSGGADAAPSADPQAPYWGPGQPYGDQPPYAGQQGQQPAYPGQDQPYPGQGYPDPAYPAQPGQAPQYQGDPFAGQPQAYPGQPAPGYQGEPTQQSGYPAQQQYPDRPAAPGQQPPGYPYAAQGGGPGASGQYPYPYGSHYPAGVGDAGGQPAKRPAEMHVSLVLLILSALPALVFSGLFLVAISLGAAEFRRQFGGRLPTGGTIESLFAVIVVVVGLVLVLAILYLVFSVVAYRGRNWARIVVTIFTGVFDAMLLLGLVQGGTGDPIALALVLGVIVFSVVGVILLNTKRSSAFIASARR